MFPTETIFYRQEGANLRGQCVPDALCCPRLRRSAPPCHGSIPGGSVHGASGARSECAVRPFQRHWHMSGVCAFSFCGRPGRRCRRAVPLRNKEKTFFLIDLDGFVFQWDFLVLFLFSFCYANGKNIAQPERHYQKPKKQRI